MALPITALYGGLLGLMILLLAVRIPPLRFRLGIYFGDGGEPRLQRAVRLHGNAVEYVPLVLILMALAESMAVSAWWLHGVGIALLLGRLLYVAGLQLPSRGIKVVAMGLTFVPLLAIAVICLARALQSLSVS